MEWDHGCPLLADEVFACGVCGRTFERDWQLEIHWLTAAAGSLACR